MRPELFDDSGEGDVATSLKHNSGAQQRSALGYFTDDRFTNLWNRLSLPSSVRSW